MKMTEGKMFLCFLSLDLIILVDLSDTSKSASSSGGDQTNLSTSRSHSGGGGRMTNMLMVTTTEGVFHRVHGHTSHSRPDVSLDSVLVVSSASLEHGLVGSAATSDHTDHGSGRGVKGLLGAGRESDSGGSLVFIVGDDDDVLTGSSGVLATIAGLGLDVADHSTLRDLVEGEDVADGEGSLLAAVDGLTEEHTFGGDHDLVIPLVLVRVSELNLDHGSTSTGVVDDLLDDTSNVAVSLGVIERSHLGRTDSVLGVGSEHGAFTLSLDFDSLSHRLSL